MLCAYCSSVVDPGRLKWRPNHTGNWFCSKACRLHWRYSPNKQHVVSAFAGQGAWFRRITEEQEAFARRAWAVMQRMHAEGFGCYSIERETGVGYRTVHRWLRNGGPSWLEKAAQVREAELMGRAG